jgi:peroxiredoxin Q/BCP
VLLVDVGDVVDDFALPDEHGQTVLLSGVLLDGPVVLFFYPGAMTKGCTKESCHFRDLEREFAEFGATRVGISMDTVDKQRAFAETYALGFPLLSDEGGAVADQFGVRRRWMTLLPVRRETFVIAPDRTVLGVVTNEIRMDVHANRALEILRASMSQA